MKKSANYLLVVFLIFCDVMCAVMSVVVSVKLLYRDRVGGPYDQNFTVYMILAALLFVILNFVFGCYYFGFAGRGERFNESLKLALSVTLCGLMTLAADRFVFHYIMSLPDDRKRMPSEAVIIICLFMFGSSVLVRVGILTFKQLRADIFMRLNNSSMKRALIFGCGEAGTFLINKLQAQVEDGIFPVAGIDINPQLWNKRISGVKVVGGNEDLDRAIEKYNIDEVIVCVPRADKDLLRSVFESCKQHKCLMRRFGSLSEITAKSLDRTSVKEINLEELLRRDSVALDMEAIGKFIKDKVVLVTGGCGSIGSEICRQVLALGCEKLLVFDINENGLFYIGNELAASYGGEKYITLVGSVRDRDRLKEVFDEYKPHVVFHAAAHKHVPMMEINPKEALKNNVFGTMNVAKEAITHKSEKFILISTDKAVNPANVMGASKRIAERSLQMLNKTSGTEIAAVRFGNVLGSNGSVVPFFQQQIAKGGPVTVTHEEMKRYFMTIPEAVQLVLEAGAIAKGGEIFVLDMGEPVKIYDLACDLIKLSGHEPNEDIKIEIIGLRPGEKLYEEISLAEEEVSKTSNSKIYVMKSDSTDDKKLAFEINRLENSVYMDSNFEVMFENIRVLVPTFNHNNGDAADAV